MSKVEKQNEFVRSLVRLFTWLDLNGYQVTLGEAYRPPETAALYAKQGKGITNSLHCEKLALDINVFKDGVLLVTVEDTRPVGEFWESLSTPSLPHAWGGNFTPPDADHYSLADGGRK